MGKAPKVSTGLKTLKQTSTMGKAPKVSTGLKKGRENLPHFKLAISVDGCPERLLVMVQSNPSRVQKPIIPISYASEIG